VKQQEGQTGENANTDTSSSFSAWSEQKKVTGTYQFGQLGRRQVITDFSGGRSSDGGLVLIAQLDRHYRITQRLLNVFLKTIET